VIPLHVEVEVDGANEDFVLRVGDGKAHSAFDAEWADEASATLALGSKRIHLAPSLMADLTGDVLLVRPSKRMAHRLIRAQSSNNFFLVTEQCDQLCVFCSQPPKKTHLDRFKHFERAALLAPNNCRITITGGEPTLHKKALFSMMAKVRAQRPDVTFHVLSNGQHFQDGDSAFLLSKAGRAISWGIPLYSSDAALHDELVGKIGAYTALLQGLSILCQTGSALELRTVVTKKNAFALPRTARFIAANLPFADSWAIMQLESIGFARNRWPDLFFDTSMEFAPVAEAIDIARLSGQSPRLFNFPLCTVPTAYRRFALPTISDWKRRYLADCEACQIKTYCGGFFAWYPEAHGFEAIGLK
jgi:His-Xaa-Ser system radical SAM maturase HxsC